MVRFERVAFNIMSKVKQHQPGATHSTKELFNLVLHSDISVTNALTYEIITPKQRTDSSSKKFDLSAR